ncbi:AI-2E family transporter [Alteromonas pelagimontana]|uniref:AI-2E family transporter n=1 Tax=Alteromonas pelagimontana TaxID=1858656 RepID=A0A6M4MCR2_9ALTE|nr:AI-2E family transporter [Alteromonas pelagimontana]QJR80440.1 AI-2E family transporter [Alteromonas pelagimontana]
MNTKLLAKRTFIQASTAALVVLLVWALVHSGKIVLTLFGGMLIAVLFRGSANWLGKKTNVSTKIWLPVTIIAPFLLLGLFFGYTAPKVAAQASELTDRLPQAVDYIQEQISDLHWTDQLNDNVKDLSSYDPKVSTIVNAVSGFFYSAINGIGNFIFALFLGLFLAVNPKGYINGAVTLVPPIHRQRVREVLNGCGSALTGWFVAKIASMILVGILTTGGLWALGVDLALILGIIAALLSFIPNLGPIIGFIPAAMISVMSGVDALLYVTSLYVAVQAVESYVLTPVLQAEIADLPPALTLFAQVTLGGMVGLTGILLAAPLMVTLMVIVRMWYVEDLLEAKTAKGAS